MTGEADAERLIVLLEARIRDFEKNMQKASGTAGQQYGRMRRDSKSATAQMEADMIRSTTRINQALATGATKIGAYSKAFAGGLIGGVAAGGIAGIVSQISQVAKGIAQIGDEAKRAGVSARAFQEWKFVAEQNRIGIDQMVDGLKELNLRADEFVQTGKGSAAEAFMRLGYSADDLKQKLKDPSNLMLEIIDRLGKMDKAAQIRISDELFGGSAGERFVELLDQGEDGIRRTIEQAHNLGVVMDDEVIAKAAELDQKFNAIVATVGTGLKTAIVEAASALQEFINTFRGWWQEYEQRRNAAEAGMLAGSLVGTLPDGSPPSTRTTPKTDRLPKAEWTPPTPPPGGFGGGGSSSSRDRAAAQAEREAESVRKLIAELEEELRLVGASDQAKRAAEATRRAGASATDAERQKIIALNEAIYQEQAAIEALKEKQEALADAGGYAFDLIGDALGSIADGSVKAEDALKKLVVQLALAAAQGALLGQGPLAGLFGAGGLFGGGGTTGFASEILSGSRIGLFAKGGVSNRPAIFGEGPLPEAAVPLPDGRRIPVDLGKSRAEPSPVNISFSPTVNVQGGSGNTGEEVTRALKQFTDREFTPRVVKALREIKTRGLA